MVEKIFIFIEKVDISVFDKLIWRTIGSYGAPLAQRDYYLALHSSLFGPDGADNYDYIVTTNCINSVNWLKMYSSHWHTQSHTLTFVEPIWPMLQNISKTLVDIHVILDQYRYISKVIVSLSEYW